MTYAIAFTSALILSLSLTPVVIRLACKFGYLARPHQLRWHKNTTALLGGVGIYIAFLIPVLFFIKINQTIGGLLIGSSLIFLLGLVDDALHIKPQLKLIGQILVSCVILAFGISFEIVPIRWIVLPLTIFWIVGITNAFNLLDNMDGLACGIAVICSAFLFVYSLLNGMHNLALLSIILAGSTLGFLRYNFSPAKIFMGDCGSQFLGMTIAIVAVAGTGRHISNLVVTLAIPVLILSVPIFDTTFVTLMRRFKGRPISQGGKDHTSHRLVFLGLSERKTVLLLYVLSILFGLIALLYARIDIIIVSILTLLAVIILFFFGVFLGETKIQPDKEKEAFSKNHSQREKTVLNTIFLHKRRVAEVIIDFLLICISYYAAYLLRFEGRISQAHFDLMTTSLPWLIVFRLGCFYYFGLYHGIWRYISIKDLVAIFKAVTISSILTILFLTFFFRFQDYSRVIFIIDAILILFLAAGTRILIRVLRESFISLKPGEKQVLIFGAGDAGEIALREIRYNKGLNYHPVGFLDDNPKKTGRSIHGVPVLGTRQRLKTLVKERNVEEVIIAIPSAPQEVLDSLFHACQECGIKYKRMAGVLWE
jgi:UDP-GlcNAc:undecaprenyl-phosphate GlcNAc-1-phosphate transferase